MIKPVVVKNLTALRILSALLPLKHKLNFLVRDYLRNNSQLVIKYYKEFSILIMVNDSNHATVEEVILRGIKGQPEAALIKSIKKDLPDRATFIDVGGNIGTFFWQFVDVCKKVYVFEPIPRLNDVITQSIRYNNVENIVLIPKAVGNETKTIKMLDNNNSSVVDSSESLNVIEIPVTSLDFEFQDLEKVDFVKIDVEGYELNVLKGAENLIDKYRPILLIEIHPIFLINYGHRVEELIEFMENRKYNIRFYSFLEELRMPRYKRIFSRWLGNKGIRFSDKAQFLKDINIEPKLTSYHFYCEPV
jgi:FkbM family methyltransferase